MAIFVFSLPLFPLMSRSIAKAKFPRRFFLAVTALCLLAGCQQPEPVEAMFDNYHTRLARTLNVPRQIPTALPSEVYPTRRILTQPLTPVKVDLLEFLRLSRCDVQRLVGQRNSSLGRVMSHSQRFIYEARFLQAGKNCLQRLLRDAKQTKIQAILQHALTVKSAERRLVTWNATIASQEFQQLFSGASKPLGLDFQRPSELIDALGRLRWQVQRWHSADIGPEADLEALYQVIGADSWLGQLAESLKLINSQLQALNKLQQVRLDSRPLCFKSRTNRHADAMNSVFFKYYIGEVQPYLARVNQHGSAVLAELDNLRQLSTLGGSPAETAFTKYWQRMFAGAATDGVNSQWQAFESLLAQHTQNWQAQLKQCGLMPER